MVFTSGSSVRGEFISSYMVWYNRNNRDAYTHWTLGTSDCNINAYFPSKFERLISHFMRCSSYVPLLRTEIDWTRAWIRKHVCYSIWYVIIHPCPIRNWCRKCVRKHHQIYCNNLHEFLIVESINMCNSLMQWSRFCREFGCQKHHAPIESKSSSAVESYGGSNCDRNMCVLVLSVLKLEPSGRWDQQSGNVRVLYIDIPKRDRHSNI